MISADAWPLIAAALITAGGAVFSVGLAHLVRWRRLSRRIREQVATQVDPGTAPPAVERRPRRGAARLSPGLQRRLTRTSYGATVQAWLTRAGLGLKASDFILLQVGAGGVLGLAGLVLAPGSPIVRLLAAAALGAVGAAAPLLVLKRRIGGRLTTFEAQLPPAIEAMAATLQAGSSLQQAMTILAREMPPPISEEFRRVLREAEMGLSFSDSLDGLMKRVPSADLVIFTSAVSIQQRVGGDLARILQVISHTIRERLRIRAETKVLTAQGRYSAYIVAGLPVILFTFLWLTNYQYLSGLFLPGITRFLLIAGIVGIVLGYFSMQKIVAVEM